jgi:hypothetical protein
VVAEMVQVIILPAALLSSFPGYCSLPSTYTVLTALVPPPSHASLGRASPVAQHSPGASPPVSWHRKYGPCRTVFLIQKGGSASPAAQGLEIGWSTALQVAVRLCTYPPTAPLRRPAPLDTSHFSLQTGFLLSVWLVCCVACGLASRRRSFFIVAVLPELPPFEGEQILSF